MHITSNEVGLKLMELWKEVWDRLNSNAKASNRNIFLLFEWNFRSIYRTQKPYNGRMFQSFWFDLAKGISKRSEQLLFSLNHFCRQMSSCFHPLISMWNPREFSFARICVDFSGRVCFNSVVVFLLFSWTESHQTAIRNWPHNRWGIHYSMTAINFIEMP